MGTVALAIAAERGLEAQVRSRAEAVGDRVTLLEAVYDPQSAPERLELSQLALFRLGPGEAVRRFPLLLGAVATEVGYDYEGVGTEFWPRFETAVQAKLDMADRRAIGGAFRSLQQRLPLVEPVESAFNDVFSIIAWPLVHALMPRELAPAVSRLLARAPMRALPRRATAGDFGALRAWASAAEGRRLTDWLKLEGPTARVLAALLDRNGAGRLTAPVFARLSDAFRADWASFSALEGARAKALAPVRQGGAADGRLSLRVDGTRAVLSVSWPPLPAALEAAARGQACVKGWRPRLWGRARTHAHNALGAGATGGDHRRRPARTASVLRRAGPQAVRDDDWNGRSEPPPDEDRWAAADAFGAFRRVIRSRRKDYPGLMPSRRYAPLLVDPTDGDAARAQAARDALAAARRVEVDVRNDLILELAGRSPQTLERGLSNVS